MAIYRLLQGSAFAPEDIEQLTDAYEKVLVAFNLTDRADPVTELIAKRILEIAQTGVTTGAEIAAAVIEQFHK
jgi:hypothetical protein